jgi:hypothetical protein
MSDFTTALERELQRLEGEIRQDPRVRRITQIRQLLADYQNGGAPHNPAPTAAAPTAKVVVSAMRRRGQRVRLSKRANIRMAVKEFLQEGGTMHRSVILKHLIGQNLMGHEKNPMAQLAAYLSSWRDLFAPDGQGNFTLKKATETGGKQAPVSH